MSTVLKKLLSRKTLSIPWSHRRNIHTTKALSEFWVRDEKAGYRDKDRKYPPKLQMIREGMKELKGEIALWSQEMKERLESDPILVFRPGETDVMWDFGSPQSLEKWTVTTDKDNSEGSSSCSFTLSKEGNAVFSGELNTKVPKDGQIKRTGYCNIRSFRVRKSFKRDSYLDWSCYNTLVIKVRGDGRSYMLNISTKGYYDFGWNDIYHYVLYTRGGPYWQVSRIPFSKFFFSSKGRIQDKQCPLPRNRISHFGVTAADKINGPFQLEIAYVGVEFDPNHIEEFAYEMYQTDKYIAGH